MTQKFSHTEEGVNIMTNYYEEVIEIAKDYDLELDEAEEVQSLAEELGVDVDDAVIIQEEL